MNRSDAEPCAGCGNRYDKSFQIIANGDRYTFDCFECAIHVLAPRCARCGIRIIGHDLESNGAFYCCDHCARAHGVTELEDRT